MDYRGFKAKDKITGYEGIVNSHYVYLYNVDRIGIQSQELNDGQPKESVYFDINQIEFIGDAPVIEPVKLIDNPFKLGDLVEDELSNYQGKITAFGYWLNGCVRCICQSPQLKDGVPVEEAFLNIKQLRLKKQEVVKEENKNVKVGGPMKAPKVMRNPK